MTAELTFKIYGKDKYNNLIFISNEGKYYNENGNISEGIIHDYRDNPPTIMRIEKAKGHDRYRNWLRLESYEYDELVYLVEREITYYEDSE